MRILVVEDEPKVAAAARDGLRKQGYEVCVAHTGEEGYFALNQTSYDLVVLDLMLPGRDGYEVLATIRKKDLTTRVLILTARDAIEDRVLGLDTGADDYLVKPFAFPELLARIRALLRRGAGEQPTKLKLADLELDLLTRRVVRNGHALSLTTREFELLEYLLRHHDQIVTREMLARDVWQSPTRATPIDNVIDVHMARLRRKIDDPFEQKLIHTVRGMGFTARKESP